MCNKSLQGLSSNKKQLNYHLKGSVMWAKNHCIPEHDVVVTRCSTNTWQNNLVKESLRARTDLLGDPAAAA